MTESFLNGRVMLHAGDCLAVLPTLAENSIDSVCCDPPYHLQSITKRFAKTGRTDSTRTTSGPHQRTANGFMNKQWDGGDIAYRVETWAAVLCVLKPGAYCLAFGSTRGGHNMAYAMEQAGFIMHPFIAWVFSTGFPKATRVQFDEWEGWRYGTQSLKPAIEPIYVGQKPFSEKTGTANVLRWGTGALNIDGCRVGVREKPKVTDTKHGGHTHNCYGAPSGGGKLLPPGRWPANLCHDGSDEVIEAFPQSAGQQACVTGNEPSSKTRNVLGLYNDRKTFEQRGDSGSAARFFYSAKASKADRAGSSHPTVKPIALMRWLCRLITPPGGTVLDCFAGTGTTAEAAYREGFNAVLIEREPEYQADIRRRMALILAGPDERKRESTKARGKTEHAGPLFGDDAP